MKQGKIMRISEEAYLLAERFAESDDRSIANATAYLIKRGYESEKKRRETK